MSRRGIAARRASVALLALALLFAGFSASAAGVGRGSAATAMKKKKKRRCKPGFHRVKSHGKKRCERRAGVPLVRATLTWNTAVNLDLWAWDPSGGGGRASGNPIPRTSFAGRGDAFGPETFTDLSHIDGAARAFSFGVCYQADGTAGGPTQTRFTLVYVTADRASHTLTGALDGVGSVAAAPGGPAIPVSTAWCPA